MVAVSTDRSKPAHRTPGYLQSRGFRIIPVNPGCQVAGEHAVDSLNEIAEPVDVIDVFRPSEETLDIARGGRHRRRGHPDGASSQEDIPSPLMSSGERDSVQRFACQATHGLLDTRDPGAGALGRRHPPQILLLGGSAKPS